MNEKELLPPEVLRKAILSGRGWGWCRKDLPDVVEAARRVSLACLGGQVQIISDGTCELYWRNYDVAEQSAGEGWHDFVERSAAECLKGIERIGTDKEILQDGLDSFAHLRSQEEQGIDLHERIYYIMYFQKPTGQPGEGARQ